ncbi:MAG: hypothetical protein WBP64_03590 [Nitrososphaeraceae archaeon]
MNKFCYYSECNNIADWCFETIDLIRLYACDHHVMNLREHLRQEGDIILNISATPHLLNPDPSIYQDN